MINNLINIKIILIKINNQTNKYKTNKNKTLIN